MNSVHWTNNIQHIHKIKSILVHIYSIELIKVWLLIYIYIFILIQPVKHTHEHTIYVNYSLYSRWISSIWFKCYICLLLLILYLCLCYLFVEWSNEWQSRVPLWSNWQFKVITNVCLHISYVRIITLALSHIFNIFHVCVCVWRVDCLKENH